MKDILPFIITGLVTGTVYGLAGTGLVLTFKTSGIFNFGHGAVLTAARSLLAAVRRLAVAPVGRFGSAPLQRAVDRYRLATPLGLGQCIFGRCYRSAGMQPLV